MLHSVLHHIMSGYGGIILAIHHAAGSLFHAMSGYGGIIL
jgi:hypothetical protein